MLYLKWDVSAMRVLIIEDEKRLASTLADMLGESRHLVDIALEGIGGLDSARSGIYDAIILDVMLPGMDGFEIVSRLRDEGVHTPVLMLTARSELDKRVKGLDLGADYYLTKPFEPAELLACLRAISRRKGEVQPEEMTFGDMMLSPSLAQLCCGERCARLGAKELELMRLLMTNKGMILSKEQVLLRVWGYDSEAEGNSVEVYMSFLRKKLLHIHSRVKITSVRMLGYRLEDQHD